MLSQFMTVMLPHSGRVWYRNCDAFIGRSKHMAERFCASDFRPWVKGSNLAGGEILYCPEPLDMTIILPNRT